MVREVSLGDTTLRIEKIEEEDDPTTYHWEYESPIRGVTTFSGGSAASGEFETVSAAIQGFIESGRRRGTCTEYRLMKGDEVVLTLETGENYLYEVTE
ncbi:MAG: hypothetical protein ABEK04_03455 [Candidatus Nanohalobium sp.]